MSCWPNCDRHCGDQFFGGCFALDAKRRRIEAHLPPHWRTPLPPKAMRTPKQEVWAAMRDVQMISWAAQRAGLRA